jgi:hypothetical protein
MTEHDKDYFIKMLDELRAIREKYGLPKGMLFSPNRLEISIKRNSYDNVHLSYKEYFDYLPDMLLDLVIPTSINMIVQNGVPKERVERIGQNGVGLEIDGTTILVMSMVLSELAIQKRFTEKEFEDLMIASTRTVRALTETSGLEFEWTDEIGKRYWSALQQLGAVLKANPSVVSEMQAIQKKYSTSIEKVRTILDNKPDQPTSP